jgi:hypothetical protein
MALNSRHKEGNARRKGLRGVGVALATGSHAVEDCGKVGAVGVAPEATAVHIDAAHHAVLGAVVVRGRRALVSHCGAAIRADLQALATQLLDIRLLYQVQVRPFVLGRGSARARG